jgi:23S rRNA pseudouridine2605 synthase
VTDIEEKERLQKFMAGAGVASRRHSEEMIAGGRVRVNGQIVREPGFKVGGADRVEVDGLTVARRREFDYLMLHKPVGVISSARDDRGRRTVVQLLGREFGGRRLYPVGRLDFDTSGLMLLTNDGEMTYKLTHPRFEAEKTYLAWTPSLISAGQLRRLAGGVRLEDGMTAPARARLVSRAENISLIEITIHEGRNRQVRRMLEAVGLETRRLKRIAFGPLTLERDLTPGGYRLLRGEEITALRRVTEGRAL